MLFWSRTFVCVFLAAEESLGSVTVSQWSWKRQASSESIWWFHFSREVVSAKPTCQSMGGRVTHPGNGFFQSEFSLCSHRHSVAWLQSWVLIVQSRIRWFYFCQGCQYKGLYITTLSGMFSHVFNLFVVLISGYLPRCSQSKTILDFLDNHKYCALSFSIFLYVLLAHFLLDIYDCWPW